MTDLIDRAAVVRVLEDLFGECVSPDSGLRVIDEAIRRVRGIAAVNITDGSAALAQDEGRKR